MNTIQMVNYCNPFFEVACYLYTPIPPTTASFMPTTYITTNPFTDGYDNNTSSTIPPVTTTPYFNYSSSVNIVILVNASTFDWSPNQLNRIDPEVALTVFNLFMCTVYDFTYLCPNFCLSKNPCYGLLNLKTTECYSDNDWYTEIFKLENLPFNRMNPKAIDFTCHCIDGYTWSTNVNICAFGGFYPNPCDPITNKPCNEVGTATCVGDLYNGEFFCHCKPHYVGVLCDELINACTMNVVSLDGDTEAEIEMNVDGKNNKYTNGNTLCRVNMSGIPINGPINNCTTPEIGSRRFSCECALPFIEDITMTVSNCALLSSACYNMLCVYGKCVESVDGSSAVCDCEDDYEGPQCSHSVTRWSHWSECQPECGTRRIRKRLRGSTIYKYLNYSQLEICPDRLGLDCPDSSINKMNILGNWSLLNENQYGSSPLQKFIKVPFTNDELHFYAYYLMSLLLGLVGLTVVLYCSRLITTSRFVHHKKRQKKMAKTKRELAKQRFSLWKVEYQIKSKQN